MVSLAMLTGASDEDEVGLRPRRALKHKTAMMEIVQHRWRTEMVSSQTEGASHDGEEDLPSTSAPRSFCRKSVGIDAYV